MTCPRRHRSLVEKHRWFLTPPQFSSEPLMFCATGSVSWVRASPQFTDWFLLIAMLVFLARIQATSASNTPSPIALGSSSKASNEMWKSTKKSSSSFSQALSGTVKCPRFHGCLTQERTWRWENASAINKTLQGALMCLTLREEQARLGHCLVAWPSNSSELSYLVSDSMTTPCNDISDSPTPLGEICVCGVNGWSPLPSGLLRLCFWPRTPRQLALSASTTCWLSPSSSCLGLLLYPERRGSLPALARNAYSACETHLRAQSSWLLSFCNTLTHQGRCPFSGLPEDALLFLVTE